MFKRFFRWLGFHVHEWGNWQPVHEYDYVQRYYQSNTGTWGGAVYSYKAIVLRRECACGDFATKTRSVPQGIAQ